ncbi:hypothetical protein A2526_00700 [candidate division WOR-1 bacterium RIFOXYD2_FULL_36_8]|uniref:Glucose-1-phosphate thymidylyltransferase n=1 Tax=candidate division WOR-1 bacterium RIFOXYB2_FULL_36_35 TaxID=1802578 RepID=A0A1F4S389_UNCSA|nr:MAG: hypothetical protein A2230_06860 [candidate division WOR-1 bacterium RIFOXYA2_FULL_36_21]OGC14849.1 MAG: hypothetical protein A2290_00965 [candidate division WOR-1 bacterium RIFOXYB2_FULL_36_35]OGC15601.1 MAG: hypothetical protein A2282_09210 [candidate division WOR-1 bacterium RIFOXYA12_FULL_36_13]OGC41706.1 MAG: hypothetical protein A2526_00700 [candidate division WOR-1 bacterium RIFOXYD2_FULL_36_8]
MNKEDKKLFPLTVFRSKTDLICGALPISQKNKGFLREITYPWDLISNLKEDIEEDFRSMDIGIKGKVHKTAVLINKENIHIGKDAEISPCAVLDASKGPIYIGEKTIVHPHTLIRGPLYIGKECRIAGEIVHSVIMDYTNKGHYGFIGHSYICSWVNLGAGTTNSNLKNNYGNVKVQVDGKMIDSGQTFLGCFIGDHTKTAIGTMIYTGCVVGVCANLFGEPYYKKMIPSFAWGTKGKQSITQAIEIATAAMARRNVEFTSKDKKLFNEAFDLPS